MKKLLFVLPFLALVACGGDEKKDGDKEVILDSKEKKISYVLGHGEAKGLLQAPFKGQLNKKKILEGFKSKFGEEAPSQSCEQSLYALFGPEGMEFNVEYAEEGCLCMGEVMSFDLYRNLKNVNKATMVDKESLYAGFKDALFGDSSRVNKAEEDRLMTEFKNEVQAAGEKMQSERMTQVETNFGQNKIAGQKFLEENGKKSGVITTASGLQYKVLKKGSGPIAKLGDPVKIDYLGTLLDGTEFDSSVERGPYALNVGGQVINGWNEMLQLMNKGMKVEVYVPNLLAYGPSSPGAPIEPLMTLKFIMEMVDHQVAPAQQQPGF